MDHEFTIALTSASGCATMVANMMPLMMTDQAVKAEVGFRGRQVSFWPEAHIAATKSA
jgi:hypothetical protein